MATIKRQTLFAIANSLDADGAYISARSVRAVAVQRDQLVDALRIIARGSFETAAGAIAFAVKTLAEEVDNHD